MPYGVRFAAKQLLYMAVGLVLSRTRLFGGLPSFAVAFVSSVHGSCTLAACIGAAAGSLLFAPDLLTGLTGAAAVLACGMICFALRAITGVRMTSATAFIVSSLCCAAAGGTMLLAEEVKNITGIETTATILGHIQRGGSPTVKDRVVAGMMGVKAVQCLKNGEVNKIIAYKGDKCVAIDIEEALAVQKQLDPDIILASEILNV